LSAEWLRQDKKKGPVGVFFCIPTPAETCQAEVYWREHSLGKVELPVLGSAEFVQGLSLQMPTLHVGLGRVSVACQTFVNTQGKSLYASAVLSNTWALAPIVDLLLGVVIQRSDGGYLGNVPIHFTSGQLRARQALVTALLPKLRRNGEYTITWKLGARTLHTQRLRAISKKQFLSSLRISATRFIVQHENSDIRIVRWLPQRDGELNLEGIKRVGPCFFVCSSEAGMAGLAPLTAEAVVDGEAPVPMMVADETLVTDGPRPYVPGTLAAAELARVKHFTLGTSAGRLGILPLTPAPSAEFTPEGGFAPLDDYLWSPAAEEQLNDRLGKLLGDG
jgi:hypothetical protein